MNAIKLTSIAPFRHTINLRSERIKEGDLHSVCTEFASLVSQEAYSVQAPYWPFGYGSLEHDALPSFFQPIAILTPSDISLKYLRDRIESPSLKNFEVHIYDDTVAVLFVEWSTDESISGSFDFETTSATNVIVKHIVNHVFHPLKVHLQNNPAPSEHWRSLSDFEIYKDLADKSIIPSEACWVARNVALSSDFSDIKPWLNWLGIHERDFPDHSHESIIIRSGNSILINDNADHKYKDFIRAMSLCQFYSSLLHIYQNQLINDLHSIDALIKERGIVRTKNALLNSVEKKLDHLDYIKLRHQQALYGTQGGRKSIIESIHQSWGTDVQFENIAGWANLIRERISRQYLNQKIRQGRFIQTLLGFIGGLSIIDISLAMLASSNLHDDSIPGILDIFSILPPDGVLYIALATLIMFSISVRGSER